MLGMIRSALGLETKPASKVEETTTAVTLSPELARQIGELTGITHQLGAVVQKLVKDRATDAQSLEHAVDTMHKAVTNANARTLRMEEKYQVTWAHGVEGYVEKCGREREEALRKEKPEGEAAFWHDVLLSRCRELEKRVERLEQHVEESTMTTDNGEAVAAFHADMEQDQYKPKEKEKEQ